MTQHSFKSKVYRQIVQCLAMLAIAPLLALTPILPAQADWKDDIGNFIGDLKDKAVGFFRGDTSGRASGRSQGGGVRDTTCLLADGSRAVESLADTTETSPSEILVLAPETLQKTTQATPNLFLYMPFGRNTTNLKLIFELAIKQTPTSRQVIGEPIRLILPTNPGLMRFRFPAETPLLFGQTYEWSFRLICQTDQPTSNRELRVAASAARFSNDAIDIQDIGIPALAGAADGLNIEAYPITVRQEVFGEIERVDISAQLAAALVSSESNKHYQAYLDHNIWFDMVSALATTPSLEWNSLLKVFKVPLDNPAPEPLTSASPRRSYP